MSRVLHKKWATRVSSWGVTDIGAYKFRFFCTVLYDEKTRN